MSTQASHLGPQFLQFLAERYRWIVFPTLLCTAVAVLMAATRTRYWSASQTLVVRDDLNGGRQRGLGQFDNTEQLKSAQETITEITRNRTSVRAALEAIGPPPQRPNATNWPSARDVASAQGRITVRAPNGTEFGKTEVILVEVESESRDRALSFVAAVCEQLQNRLRELRLRRMQSIVEELEEHVRLAETDLERATNAIEGIESNLGGDLAELRLLSQSGSGDSNLRSQQGHIQTSLRDVEAQMLRYSQQRDLLAAALRDSDNLIATPSSLLDSHPSLRRLRDDLANAQRVCAELQGTLTRNHPRLRTAMLAEQESRKNLDAELQVAMRGVESDLASSTQRQKDLQQSLDNIEERLHRIASLRARYTNLTNDLNNCNQVLEKSKKELADARAGQAAADSASSVLQLEPPSSGDSPVGPAQSMIVISGFVSGLCLGGLLLFLWTPLGQTSLRRCGGYLPFGRRKYDMPATGTASPVSAGRRDSDPTVVPTNRVSDRSAPLNESYVCAAATKTSAPFEFGSGEAYATAPLQNQ